MASEKGCNKMDKNKLSSKAMKISMEDTVQTVLDILEKDDGRTFEEKKQEARQYLATKDNTILAERILKTASNDEIGKNLKDKFWRYGEITRKHDAIHIRKVMDSDKDKYIDLQKETSAVKSMLQEKAYQNMLWKEHIQDKSLMFTIEVDGEYAGFCGINNLALENWEIAIELLTNYRNKGVGYIAIGIMLSEIKTRLGVKTFRVKIYSDNYASQRLFEKLGATPYGIAEFMLHKEEDIMRCKEENLNEINDRLIQTAKKFNVEPRKLLSHVLEYELSWNVCRRISDD